MAFPIQTTNKDSSDFSTTGPSSSGLNVEDMIVAVSRLLHDQIKDDDEVRARIVANKYLNVFNEENYFGGKENTLPKLFLQMLRRSPTANDVYLFIKGFYVTAKFSPVCILVSLIYVNRFVVVTKTPLHRITWRPLVIAAILVAQKMWDDVNLQNTDFAEIYPFFTLKELTRIEAKFLAHLDFQLHVKMSLYADYYFSVQNVVRNAKGQDVSCLLDSQQPPKKLAAAH